MKRQLGPPTAEERGHLFEGWVASVLRAYRDYGDLFEDWGYWASGNGSSPEVAFILRRGKDLIALEVRSAGRSSMLTCAAFVPSRTSARTPPHRRLPRRPPPEDGGWDRRPTGGSFPGPFGGAVAIR